MSWFNLARTAIASLFGVGLGLALTSPAHAQDKPAVEALDEFRNGRAEPKAIENRFFLKENRFEIAPHFGYVPNNSFARRYVGGLVLNYHLNETLAVGADITYSPDAGKNDVKQLVGILLARADAAGSGTDGVFRQPLDKVTLAASFGVTWAPVYGKINLIGETVLNFDLYGYLGIGMVSKTNYHGTFDDQFICPPEQACAPNDFMVLTPDGNEVRVAPTIGIGQNYFLNQILALKLDVKGNFYLDQKPQYGDDPVTQQQLYNNLVVSAGIAAFFPKMKPRLYDF